MNDIILLKQGELILKGQNRRFFEQRLVANVKRRLAPFGEWRVYALQSTVYVGPKNDACDLDGAYDAMKKVFGVISLTRARPCLKDKDAITDCAKAVLTDAMRAAKSFKVESKRADKSFPMTSIQLSRPAERSPADA